MAKKEVDARAALQALFSAGRPSTPTGAGSHTSSAEQAGLALRHLFRADIQKALHPPKAAKSISEMHSQISRLLDEVAPANGGKEKTRAIGPAWTRGEMERPAGERHMGGHSESFYTEEQQRRLGVDERGQPQADLFDKMDTNHDGVISRDEFNKAVKSGVLEPGNIDFQPPERKGRSMKSMKQADIGVQTDPVLAPMRWFEPPPDKVPELPKQPSEIPRGRLRLIFQENTDDCKKLRQTVAEGRKKLFELDKETTRLTQELKRGRKALWESQREQSSTDSKIGSHIKQRTVETDAAQAQELARLEAQERELAQELSEARQVAGKWMNIAKRQDEMIKQERDSASDDDPHKILLRHPAGEIFLPPMLPNDGSDDSSDDGYPYRDGPRNPRSAGRGGPRPGIQLNDDSDEDDDYGSGGSTTASAGGGPPPPPSQRWRDTIDNESEGSAVTSPSGSESLGGTPKGENIGRGPMLGSSAMPGSAASRQIRGSSSNSESYSEDEAPVKKPVERSVESRDQAMKTTPPLPDLTSGPARGRTEMSSLAVDSAEEISEEDDLDSSRSV